MTIRVAGSIIRPCSPRRSMTSTPSPVEKPARLCPPLRTAISSPASRAKRTAVATSVASATRAIAAGLAWYNWFQTPRASS